MGFKFAWLCELLEEIHQNKPQQRAAYSKQENPSHRIVNRWFDQYHDKICRNGPSAIALLSCLFPERRPDRTYNLQQKRLTQIFGRLLGLGTTRLKILESWQQKGGQDFPTCLEKLMAETEFPVPQDDQQVTLEEIDLALTRIAANNIASAPAIRAQANEQAPIDILTPIVRRLQSNEAKWLVRMILKSYSPIEVPEYATLHSFHFLLPKLLAMQNSFEAVVDMISCPELVRLPPRPSREYEAALLPILAKEIKPQLGVMIRRQPFDKARSIKHCVKTAGSRVMSIERKYDGEYCQIHIDNSKGQGTIQIFSKSGKDSTQDRIGLHSAIKAGLKLKSPECKIKRRAILEGELLIYSRNEKDILPFHHIRKHVRHGGRRIGTEQDSPRKSGEHLMIVFFDVLMLEDKVMLNEPHRVRRAHLKGMVTPIDGEVQVVERTMIDFGHSSGRDLLTQTFSHAIRMRWEGFVLKGLEDPYYSWKQGVRGIKLKKDYIAGLGDSADLCIVGGHRDPKIETELDIGRLSWTTFYVGCLTNKPDVQRFNARPTFRIIDRLGPGSMSKDDILAMNFEGQLVEREFVADSEFMFIKHTRRDLPPPISIYTKPMVVEIFGAGFERPQSSDFFILRFPRRVGSKIKIHKDRGISDTVDFDELQEMAQISLKEQDDAATQEEIEWIERLLAADPKPKYIIDKSQSTSPSKTQRSATTINLTPAGSRWSSTQSPNGARWMNTQPSPVPINAIELIPVEHYERHPDSAPQTPSRRSDSTESPTSAHARGVSKCDFANIEASPTITSRKRKRVVFEPTHLGLNLRTMSDMTNMATEDWKRREITGSASVAPRDEGAEDADVMITRDKETEKDKAVTAKRLMAPPELKRTASGTRSDEPKKTKTATVQGPVRSESKETTTKPRKSGPKATEPEKDKTMPAATALDTARSSKPESTVRAEPSSSTRTQDPLVQPNPPISTSTRPRKPAASIMPYLTISGPILITPSIAHPNTKIRNTTDPTQVIRNALAKQNLTHTTNPTEFASTLFPVPADQNTDNTTIRRVILIDVDNDHGRQGVRDVKAMIDCIPLPAPEYRPTAGNTLFRDVVIFDYRVIGTEYWKRVLARGDRKEVQEDVSEDLDWMKCYCGTFECSVAYVGNAREDGKPYEASGEMIWT